MRISFILSVFIIQTKRVPDIFNKFPAKLNNGKSKHLTGVSKNEHLLSSISLIISSNSASVIFIGLYILDQKDRGGSAMALCVGKRVTTKNIKKNKTKRPFLEKTDVFGGLVFCLNGFKFLFFSNFITRAWTNCQTAPPGRNYLFCFALECRFCRKH